jgi:hypothetical protein
MLDTPSAMERIYYLSIPHQTSWLQGRENRKKEAQEKREM